MNISLFDAKTKLAITDAQVKVKMADAIGGETRTLEVMSINNMLSYGAYFHMSGMNPYTITAQIQRPGVAGISEASFDYILR